MNAYKKPWESCEILFTAKANGYSSALTQSYEIVSKVIFSFKFTISLKVLVLFNVKLFQQKLIHVAVVTFFNTIVLYQVLMAQSNTG